MHAKRSGFVVLLIALAGCNAAPAPRVSQPSDEACGELTYENFAADFFDDHCLRCHSRNLTNIFARNGAPGDVNFDTLTGVRANLSRIRTRAGVNGDMPPSDPKPSAAARAKLLNWIDCGAVSEED